jgi:hypothetical protein
MVHSGHNLVNALILPGIAEFFEIISDKNANSRRSEKYY